MITLEERNKDNICKDCRKKIYCKILCSQYKKILKKEYLDSLSHKISENLPESYGNYENEK